MRMNEPMTLGRWMKRLRADRDMTQEALAEDVGCAVYTIRTLESGTRRPSRDLADRLAEKLQVPQEQRAEFLRVARSPITRSSTPAAVADVRSAERDAPAGSPTTGATLIQTAGVADVSASARPPEQGPLLLTKLYLPRPRAQLVSRPRLLARLEAGLAGPLTLIAAPAGFGKTTLLADWLGRSAATSRHVAWLALDAGDADPLQFLRYFIAAIQTIAPAIGAGTLPLLSAAQVPPIETLLPLLLNDLVRLPERSILVLDDYHVVDAPAVHRALAFLLDHLPTRLHLVIASRADPPLPLSRLRARGQLTELRAHDLRFTPEEAAMFLREVMGLTLSVEDVAALETRTEGWIAGLQLAALSLQDRPDAQRAAFIEAFTGSHRFVVDYLLDEVLARQPRHVQTFLLQTSILERLAGPLCDAVVLGDGSETQHTRGGRGQAYSQLLLEELERGNLFILPLDDERRWYRYHHLFAQVLRERLASGARPETVARLHRHASSWFEGQGLVVEAVRHALVAHDWERAARLIEEHGLGWLILRGQVHTVLGWLNALPEALLRAHPDLLHYHALALFSLNQLDAAELREQVVEEVLSSAPPDDRARTILGHATGLRAAIAHVRGDVSSCVTLARKALEILPPGDVFGRTTAGVHVASSFLVSGDMAAANEHQLMTAVAAVRGSDDLMTQFHGMVLLAEFRRREGRLRQAAGTYRQAAEIAPEPGGLQVLLNGAAYYFGLGSILAECNDLDTAQSLQARGREMVRGGVLAAADAVSRGYLALARLQQAQGDGPGARVTLDELAEVARRRSFVDHLIARAEAGRAHLALLQGNLPAAVQWADSSGPRVDDEPAYLREPEYLTLARVRIAQGRHDPAGPYLRDALHLLDRLLEAAEAGARMDSVIEILVLRAAALRVQGNLNPALAALERALILAAPEGYVRVFVDEGMPMAALLGQGLGIREGGAEGGKQDPEVRAYAQKLLAVFHGEGIAPRSDQHLATPDPRRLPPGVEPLTERELEVLRLLATGQSNQAIAQQLIVAIGTVKRHVNSILGKLGVESRLQAVARARELGLL